MTRKKAVSLFACSLMLLAAAVPALAQAPRGTPNMKAGSGAISIDYGRPSLKGRDVLGMLKVGDVWRMGADQATTLKTPTALVFGPTTVAKGEYTLVMKRAAEDRLELVFQSQGKDAAAIPLKKESVASSVELLTIELKDSGKGGTFALTWGTSRLSADFTIGK